MGIAWKWSGSLNFAWLLGDGVAKWYKLHATEKLLFLVRIWRLSRCPDAWVTEFNFVA